MIYDITEDNMTVSSTSNRGPRAKSQQVNFG